MRQLSLHNQRAKAKREEWARRDATSGVLCDECDTEMEWVKRERGGAVRGAFWLGGDYKVRCPKCGKKGVKDYLSV